MYVCLSLKLLRVGSDEVIRLPFVVSRKCLRLAEEDSAMTSPLKIFSHGNPAEPCRAAMYVNSNHSDWLAPVK